MKSKHVRFMFSVVLALWASALSAQTHWTCDIDAFQHDMAVYYQLQKNGADISFADLSNYELAAFVGDECRGVGEILTEQSIHYGYLRVRSNAASGETVSFKVYVKDANQEVPIDAEANITFQIDEAVGKPSTPKALNISVFQLTVTADASKGSVTGAEVGSYYRGTQVTVKANPVTGYEFAAWSDESTDNPRTITMNGNITLSAEFTPVTYSITYGLGGGELADGASNPDSYTIEDDDVTLNNPVRRGYTFLGWSGTGISDGTPKVTIEKGSTGDRNYTAQWQEDVYTISYNLDGGQLAQGDTNPLEYTVNTETFTLKNPTKTGYTFAGWEGTGITVANATVTIAKGTTGNRSYTATWMAGEAYTIAYDLDGGALPEGESNPAAYNVETPTFTLVNPVREGYEFTGWTGTDLTKPTMTVIISAGSTGERSYTATWTVKQYQTKFVLGNGQADIVQSQDYGTSLIVPADPLRTGYKFLGWDNSIPTSMPAKDLVFTAKWELVIYTITYNLDGGSVETPNPTEYNYENEAITLNNPTKEGYTFAGWTGSGIEGTSDEVTIAQYSTGDRTYTATWAVNQYTITFKLGNGDDDVVMTQNYGTELVVPVPTRKGYNFKGWDSEVPTTVPAENKTFTAKWEVIEYKIEYSLVGGTLTGDYPTTYNIETPNFDLVNPTRDGYEFAGWIGEDLTEATMTVTIIQGSKTSNLMYTATWTEKPAVILGDVDGDGEITINDVTMTISAALGRPAAIFNSVAADVDGDGEITINDVTTIIGMALGKIKL